VANVVATIEIPRSHHGIRRPPRKKDEKSRPELRERKVPIATVTPK